MKSFDEIKDLLSQDGFIRQSIGTEMEQTVHRAIKYWLCPDPSCHEFRVNGRIADVFVDGHVYEIQTRSFYAIAKKVESLLGFHPVTVVYPVVQRKTVYQIGRDGSIGRGRVSPRKKTPASLLAELSGLRGLVGRPGLDFLVLVFDAAEYRTPSAAPAGKKTGRIDLYPQGVPETLMFCSGDDFRLLLPEGLPAGFTVIEFARALKLNRADAGRAALFLREIGILELAEKSGRAYRYRVVPACGHGPGAQANRS